MKSAPDADKNVSTISMDRLCASLDNFNASFAIRRALPYFSLHFSFPPLLAIRKHYTVAYYKLMCWQLGQ